MALCDLCNNLTIDTLYPPNLYYHAANFAALEASVENCRLCKMIHWCITQEGHELDHHPKIDFEGAADVQTTYGDHEERNACSIKLQISPGRWHQGKSQKGFRHIGIWMKSKWMVAGMTISTEEGDIIGLKPVVEGKKNSYISSRVFVSETPSEAYLNVAKGWLDTCERKHRVCQEDSPKTPQLPARVICVTEEGKDPYVIESQGKCGRYVTLSHCWGGSKAAILTRDSLQTLQKGLSMESLPKTFRDAIQVCRKLGIPYLWIDSLCIIQDDKDDWERQSRNMDSIYYDSTLTISASDSEDSSKGLFLPRKPYDYCWYDIVALPESFADNKGRAYVTSSTWGTSGTPVSDVYSGILQSRGWVMQEGYLSRRTLHFPTGQMAWMCCEKTFGQGGFEDDVKGHYRKFPRNEMKAFARGFKKPYKFMEWGDHAEGEEDEDEEIQEVTEQESMEEREQQKEEPQSDAQLEANTAPTEDTSDGFAGSDQDTDTEEKEDNDTSVSYITSLDRPDGGRPSLTIDLRSPQHQIPPPPPRPAPISREIDNELYNFLDVASRHTIHHVWFTAVSDYTGRQLTFASDKLPALSGIASRAHAITRDEYLAGHWRRELERSLFWSTCIDPRSCTPGRVKEYRAPSWSWASVEGQVSWRFADLAPGKDTAAPIEILSAEVQVDGSNLFGCVKSGRITLRASTVRAKWDASKTAWKLPGLHPFYGRHRRGNLNLVGPDPEAESLLVGQWHYDDTINGIMPGPVLTEADADTNKDIEAKRAVPTPFFMPTAAINDEVHGKDFLETPLYKRGTYVPEELVLVQGPTRKIREYYREAGARVVDVDVLILARVGGNEEGKGKEGGGGGGYVYKRVGIGELGSWDETVSRIEILTII